MPGIDIAEIAGRHAERHRPPDRRQRAERETGGNVINDLRRTRAKLIELTADRVKILSQPHPRTGLTMSWQSSKFPRSPAHARSAPRRRHLAALHLGNPAMREQHEDVEGARSRQRERGGAGIADVAPMIVTR